MYNCIALGVILNHSNNHSLVLTSAGGVLTSAHDNNQNWADHIELPNHIAPFLFSLPPMQKHDLVYFKDLGDSFVIQWTRFINHGRLLEINFQLHLQQVINCIGDCLELV